MINIWFVDWKESRCVVIGIWGIAGELEESGVSIRVGDFPPLGRGK